MPSLVKRRFAGLALALTFAGGLALPAVAQDSTTQGAQDLAVEGLSKLMQALEMFVKSVPQYAAPEVLPNGDIIIRRVHPAPDPAPTPPKSKDDATST